MSAGRSGSLASRGLGELRGRVILLTFRVEIEHGVVSGQTPARPFVTLIRHVAVFPDAFAEALIVPP